LTPHQHLRALTDELTDLTPPANATPKGTRLLQLLQTHIQVIFDLPPIVEQRVDDNAIPGEEEQMVIDDTSILTIPWIPEAPGTMQARNPTAKQTLKNTPCLHQRVTRNNTPGIMPVSPVLPTVQPAAQPLARYHPIPTGARLHIVTCHAINALTATELESCQDIFTPDNLSVTHQGTLSICPEHFTCPMVHLITRETISSYK
jgi:hypothetical protein